MKKVLFATTALIATAGVASADVAISGYAEMGIIGGDNNFDTQFHTDIDATFSMSGTTDNGIAFGATVDLDENGAFGNTTQGGETIFIKGAFGTLTMGDTDGALDWAVTEGVGNPGSIADDETAHAGYNGFAALDGSQDGQIARWDYTMGDLSVGVSAEIDDAGNDSSTVGFGVKFSAQGVNFGVGVQNSEDASATGASVNTTVGAVSVGVAALSIDNDTAPDVDHVQLSLGTTMGASSFGVNFGTASVAGAEDVNGFGAAYKYDLGGGMGFHVGYGDDDVRSTYSAGFAMSF